MRDMLPEAGLKRLSLSGSNQANSRATNRDLRNQMGSPFELCFSRHVLTKRVDKTSELAATVEGSCKTHSCLYNPQGRLEGNLQDTEARNRIRQTKVNN